MQIVVSVDSDCADSDAARLVTPQLVRQSAGEVLAALYDSAREHPPVAHICVRIAAFDGVADTCGPPARKTLRLAAPYFTRARHAAAGALELELRGVVLHELVHALQYDGSATANPGFVEGLADYVRILCRAAPPHWRREDDPPPSGSRWDSGYEHTAFFLRWIERANPHVAKSINLLLRDVEWDDALFAALTGKPVDQLWAEYLASFGIAASTATSTTNSTTSADGWPCPLIEFESRVSKDAKNPFLQLYPSIAETIFAFSKLSDMCLRILYSYNPRHSPTHVESIRLIVREMDGVAHCTGPANKKEIHLSIEYLSKFLADHKNDLQVLRTEVEGVLIHELTHVWQRTCLRYPGGLVEGVADWVRLVAGYVPAHWKQKREGKWDAGYCPTAFFLAWINDQLQVTATNSTTTTPSFVQALNHYVGSLDSWNAETVFMKLADGKTVDQLWTTYCLEEEEITDAVADRIRAENVSLISNLKTLVQIAETETDPAVLRRLNAMVGKAVNQFLK